MRQAGFRLALGCSLALACGWPMLAHVGSPDVYAEGSAGPYKLFVVVRPPLVIPGVADIEVRSSAPGADNITIAPIPLVGEASKHPPVPDTMTKPSRDVQFFAGHLWIMQAGSWQVRFAVTGGQGRGVLSIPVAAASTAMRQMQSGLGILLAGLGILLLAGMVGIVGPPRARHRRRRGKLFRPQTETTHTSRWRLHFHFSYSPWCLDGSGGMRKPWIFPQISTSRSRCTRLSKREMCWISR